MERFNKFGSWAVNVFTAVLVILIAAISLFAQRLPIKTYTVADGLLRDYVFKIRQDSRGFLWFCTPGGLSRFDGYAFTNFTESDGLPDRHVNDLLETKSGRILVATDAGLAVLNPRGLSNSADNTLFTVYLPEDIRSKQFRNLFEDASGVIYAGTADGLYRVESADGGFTLGRVDLRSSLTGATEIASIMGDSHGAIWVGTYRNGLFRILPDGQVEQFTMANGLSGNSIEALLEDSNGRIWVGMRAGTVAGLCLLVAEPKIDQDIVERIFTIKDGLPAQWILALKQTSDGKLWVATIRGLCDWQGGYGDSGKGSVCRNYTEKNGICDSDVWSLTEDKDGNLWTGTRCGAKRIARYGFTTYNKSDGVDSAFVNSIFENSSGELFASFDPGNTRTISRYNGETFDMVSPNFPSDISYFGWGTKQTVWQDVEGNWWFPTSNGLYRFTKPARFEDLGASKPQRMSPIAGTIEVFRVFEDSTGDLWVATLSPTGEGGLWRWLRKQNAWLDHSKEMGFAGTDRLAWAFVEDQSGNLWISTNTNNGEPSLIRYRNGQVRIFTKTDGLPAGLSQDLFVDHTGRLWIANIASGLLRLADVNAEELTFFHYSTPEGLSTQGAMCVTEDEFGRIYACTGRGLDRLDPATGQFENFTTADGLPNSYPLMAFRDRNNGLWFGTTDGVARFIPEPVKQRQLPNALITGVRVAGVSQPISILGEVSVPTLELNSDQRQVTIDFLGLGTSLGEKLKYEYRSGGSDWTPTEERTVNFANLSSGSYQFEVRAQSTDRLYSQPATVSFQIAAPLWQRWWFIAGILGSIIFLVYAFYRYRLERLLDMERIRTRIATDLHDDIGANLTRIALLSEVADQQAKEKSENGRTSLLPSIANIARESVASMNDIVWAISPEHDSLLDLTRRMRQHAEEVFTVRDIELDYKAPSSDNEIKLSVGARRDLLLIFKEAVNNAARHSDCTKASIELECAAATLRLRIEDNGRGFEPDPENEGQGLRSMSRRAAVLGGTLNIGPGKVRGTVVEFEMPLQKIGFGSHI